MTPREKAKELVGRFLQHRYTNEDSKECALICVDEILNDNPNIHSLRDRLNHKYWTEVKREIEKL